MGEDLSRQQSERLRAYLAQVDGRVMLLVDGAVITGTAAALQDEQGLTVILEDAWVHNGDDKGKRFELISVFASKVAAFGRKDDAVPMAHAM